MARDPLSGVLTLGGSYTIGPHLLDLVRNSINTDAADAADVAGELHRQVAGDAAHGEIDCAITGRAPSPIPVWHAGSRCTTKRPFAAAVLSPPAGAEENLSTTDLKERDHAAAGRRSLLPATMCSRSPQNSPLYASSSRHSPRLRRLLSQNHQIWWPAGMGVTLVPRLSLPGMHWKPLSAVAAPMEGLIFAIFPIHEEDGIHAATRRVVLARKRQLHALWGRCRAARSHLRLPAAGGAASVVISVALAARRGREPGFVKPERWSA